MDGMGGSGGWGDSGGIIYTNFPFFSNRGGGGGMGWTSLKKDKAIITLISS